jgi:hypothetical protein
MFKLDEEQPIGMEHSKLADYCKNNGVECIDFLETDFKGKNAGDYIFGHILVDCWAFVHDHNMCDCRSV